MLGSVQDVPGLNFGSVTLYLAEGLLESFVSNTGIVILHTHT